MAKERCRAGWAMKAMKSEFRLQAALAYFLRQLEGRSEASAIETRASAPW